MLIKIFFCSKINYLSLNIDKCKVFSFTRKTDPILKQYIINDFSLSIRNSTEDLGIYFQIDLGFKIIIK